ncbi:MAG: zf-HC2 domain-containing protein [Acidobacteriota bacterium]
MTVDRHDPEIDAWRDALFTLAEDEPQRSDCPDPDELWAGAHGELTPTAVEELLDHLAECAACTEAWRLARRLDGDGDAPEQADDLATTVPIRPPRPWRHAAIGWAAAAGLVLASLLWWTTQEPPATLRQPQGAWIVDTVEAASLARRAFELSWQGPAGARYGIRVSTDDLRVVAMATDLDRAEYLVPAEALESIEAGARLFWQVTADLPDGRRIVSETFEVRLE